MRLSRNSRLTKMQIITAVFQYLCVIQGGENGDFVVFAWRFAEVVFEPFNFSEDPEDAMRIDLTYEGIATETGRFPFMPPENTHRNHCPNEYVPEDHV